MSNVNNFHQFKDFVMDSDDNNETTDNDTDADALEQKSKEKNDEDDLDKKETVIKSGSQEKQVKKTAATDVSGPKQTDPKGTVDGKKLDSGQKNIVVKTTKVKEEVIKTVETARPKKDSHHNRVSEHKKDKQTKPKGDTATDKVKNEKNSDSDKAKAKKLSKAKQNSELKKADDIIQGKVQTKENIPTIEKSILEKKTVTKLSLSITSKIQKSSRVKLLMNNSADDKIPQKLIRMFLERIREIQCQYQSMYLLIYEITLYEILWLILDLCLTENQSDLVKSLKEEMTDVTIGSKCTTVKNVIEVIRSKDTCGQMTQFSGMPHLWCTSSQSTHITPSDIVQFCGFVTVNYVNVLQTQISSNKDQCDALVWIVNDEDYDHSVLLMASESIDVEIFKMINNWPNNPPPQLDLLDDNMLKQTEFLRQQQETLGRLYLMDYIHRWHNKQTEQSSSYIDVQARMMEKLPKMSVAQKKDLVKQKDLEIEKLQLVLKKQFETMQKKK